MPLTSSILRTFVYVDGFNLYYGAVRHTKLKWLNLHSLCTNLLHPNNTIVKIKYFTALVKPSPENPDQRRRQETYISALRTLPSLEVILGKFSNHIVHRRLASRPWTWWFNPIRVKVRDPKEKGSDVNLASHLLMDAHLDLYDVAVIISNDSDLATPVRMVAQEFGKQIGIINPRDNSQSKSLVAHASFQSRLRTSVLRGSQFPDPVSDSQGNQIKKPANW